MSESEANGVASNGDAVGAGSSSASGTPQRVVRGRYAKFNGGMDVLLLEAMRDHNPFTAKHGTRLLMWQNIAEIVGEELFKNPEAYSWHTCRDRVTALMKMYADGKHDKLFKHGTVEENTRKEAILRELNLSIAKKSKVMIRPAASLLETSVAAGTTPTTSSSGSSASGSTTRSRSIQPTGSNDISGAVMPIQKRRRLESNASAGGGAGTPGKHHNPASANFGLAGNSATAIGASGSSGHLDSDSFRARVLSLIESKVQFDMDQRIKETELREQEFELQKRFLEYLQSK